MNVLTDKYGRQLTYLRLSVTDRCNFRCYYCMPEEGVNFAARESLLSFEELHMLSAIFCDMGVNKIRITGGEPFVRAGLMPFLERLSGVAGLHEITITTNGTLLNDHIERLRRSGIRKINLSLDSLSRERFFCITRRDCFEEVFACVFNLLDAGFELKINCVVAAGKNTEDIIPFIELTKQHPLAVRFLEEMPFNGGDHLQTANWNYKDMLAHIGNHYPRIEKLQSEPASTSINYQVPGYAGTFGIIPSFSRTFCGTCNRLRLSATGELRTCLYGPPAVNLRDLIRAGADESDIKFAITEAVGAREQDGFAAEAANAAIHHSMSVLGG
jgi:molybdenum cofactor biosynthesis protein A